MADASMHKHWVIVGLGNPGLAYANTRHNLGNEVVRTLGSVLSWPFKKDMQLNAEIAKGTWNGSQMHLVLPLSYMNESGRVVQRYLSYYRLTADDLVTVTDDVALPFGALRVRPDGSSGGHNGLKSIEEHLSSQRFVRLRVGVGQPRPGEELSDFVLNRFTSEESAQLPIVLEKGIKALRCITEHTVEIAMNLVNTKDW